MADLKTKFGRNLKKFREERGLTQEGLAELAGTTRDTIRNIEKGRNGPRFGLLEKIAKALKVKPKELFDF